MYRYSKLSLIAITAATVGIGSHAYAGKGMEEDVLAIGSAKISLVQAIATAEQHVHGKASRAEYEHARQGARYEVEVVSGAKVFDVRIDAAQGTVLSSTEDHADHDDHEDHDD